MKNCFWLLGLFILIEGCASLPPLSGRLYRGHFSLAQGGLVTVKVFDGSGKELKTLFKDKACIPGELPVTWDGALPDGSEAPEGHYYFSLSEQRVSLKLLARFGGLGSTQGRFLNPQSLYATLQGARLTVAVADTGNQRVQILTDMGGFLQATGSLGTGDGNLDEPTGICWDGQILTVCDSQNRRLARFDERGTYLGEIVQLTGLQTSFSTKVLLDFKKPVYMQKGPGDDFWVADSGYGTLFHVTSTGGVLEEWGNPYPLALVGPFTQFGGNFWVQSDTNHIQILDSNGNVSSTLQPTPPFQTVGGISSTGQYVVVSDPSQDILYFLDADGRVFETLSPPQVTQPTAMSIYEDHLFLVDISGHEIFHFQLTPDFVDQMAQPAVEDRSRMR